MTSDFATVLVDTLTGYGYDPAGIAAEARRALPEAEAETAVALQRVSANPGDPRIYDQWVRASELEAAIRKMAVMD